MSTPRRRWWLPAVVAFAWMAAMVVILLGRYIVDWLAP